MGTVVGGEGFSLEDVFRSGIECWMKRQSSDRKQEVIGWALGRWERESSLRPCLLFLGLDFEDLAQLMAFLNHMGKEFQPCGTKIAAGPRGFPGGSRSQM